MSSSSDLEYGSSPISGVISLYVAYASLEGEYARGANSLRRRKDVDGCLRAAERNLWSVRRKATRFRGEPWKMSGSVLRTW